MKPFENYKISTLRPTRNKKDNFKYSSQQKPLYSQQKQFKTNLSLNSEIKHISNTIIKKDSHDKYRIMATQEESSSNVYDISPFPTKIVKEEYDNTQKYINYLKEHLDSSYYANNEIKNKKSILLEKSKLLNDEIQKYNMLYEKLLKSINENEKINNNYKKYYENMLKKQKEINNNDINIEEKIKELKQKNIIINKENKSKEDIIQNLKKTLEILEKNNSGKNDEKNEKIKNLNEEKDTICKMKLNVEKMNKELYNNNIKLEEKKKIMINLLKNNNENNDEDDINIDKDKDEELLNNEIDKLQNIVENQKLLLKIIKNNQNEIKKNINEQKIINQNANKDKNSDGKINNNNKYKQLLNEEKIKNKELIMNLIKSNKEAKELTQVHNEIKEEYENKLNKIKDDIEKLLKSGFEQKEKLQNKNYDQIYAKLLEQKKNLTKFNNEFKKQLLLKKEIEKKIESTKIENEKLKNISYYLRSIKKEEEKEEKEEKEEMKDKKENEIQIENDEFDKYSSLYTITYSGELLAYDTIQKKFLTINTNLIKGWDIFIDIFLTYYNGSLLCNTIEGLYILTGTNFNDLYYYSKENNSISKILSFNYKHKYGGLILSPDKSKLIALGGNNGKKVELLNLEGNTIEELPDLLTERINASYAFTGKNILYAFLGYNNNTIEYLDLDEEKREWKNIEYTNNGVDKIYGHISVPVNENEIIIVGGKNNNKIIIFNINEKLLKITDNKIPFLDNMGKYTFEKDKNYCNMSDLNKKNDENGKDIQKFLCLDSNGNVHLFDDNCNYNIILADNHEE